VNLGNGWWLLNLAVDNPKKVIEDSKDERPEMSIQLESLKMMLGMNIRLASFDLAYQASEPSSYPFLYTGLDETSSFMPLDTILKTNAEVLPQILKAKVKNEGIKENKNGVSYGTLSLTLNATANGISKTVYEKMVVFKTEGYTIMVIIVCTDVQKDVEFPIFDTVVDSIKLLK